MEQNAVIIVDTLLLFVPFLITRLRGDLTKGAKLLNNFSCDSTCCVWSHVLIKQRLVAWMYSLSYAALSKNTESI